MQNLETLDADYEKIREFLFRDQIVDLMERSDGIERITHVLTWGSYLTTYGFAPMEIYTLAKTGSPKLLEKMVLNHNFLIPTFQKQNIFIFLTYDTAETIITALINYSEYISKSNVSQVINYLKRKSYDLY